MGTVNAIANSILTHNLADGSQNTLSTPTIVSASLQNSGGNMGLMFSPVCNIFSDTTNEYKSFISFLTLTN